MDKVTIKLTVLFEEPFWVGIFERITELGYEAAKVTFGAEPKDYQINEWYQSHWQELKFSFPDGKKEMEERKINPKRMLRNAKKSMEETGMGTKAQQALKKQHEEQKKERSVRSKEQIEAEKEQKYLLHQQKRKDKHKGR